MVKKNIHEDLSGFKDFIDLKQKAPVKTSRSSSAELLTFLDYETTRIDKITSLFSERSILLKKHPHQEKIRNDLADYNNELKTKLIEILSKEDSNLMKSLAELFNPHFRN